MHPIYQKMKEKNPKWDQQCEEALKQVHEQLVQNFLHFPDLEKPIVVITDASEFAGGSFFGNVDVEKGKLIPIGFYSMTYNKDQKNLMIHKKELLVAVKSIIHWRHLLYGHHFYLLMDNYYYP